MSTPVEPRAPESLVEVQRFLNDAFRRPHPIAEDPQLARASSLHVSGNERLTPAEQVDIYRRQYWLRHEESLRDDLPALRAALGSETWDAFVPAYLGAHPPCTPSLRDLAASVPTFLETWPQVPDARAALCADAARYELAFLDVFDGADPPPLDPRRALSLTPSDWERATFVLSPVVRRVRFDHAIHLLRVAARADPDLDVSRWLDEHPTEPTHLALFRKDLRVHYEELTRDAFLMLDALADGHTLLHACSRVAEGKAEEDAQALAANVGDWFRRWSSWGFIADIVVC